jgi:hypothetical protein
VSPLGVGTVASTGAGVGVGEAVGNPQANAARVKIKKSFRG